MIENFSGITTKSKCSVCLFGSLPGEESDDYFHCDDGDGFIILHAWTFRCVETNSKAVKRLLWLQNDAKQKDFNWRNFALHNLCSLCFTWATSAENCCVTNKNLFVAARLVCPTQKKFRFCFVIDRKNRSIHIIAWQSPPTTMSDEKSVVAQFTFTPTLQSEYYEFSFSHRCGKGLFECYVMFCNFLFEFKERFEEIWRNSLKIALKAVSGSVSSIKFKERI